MGHLLLCSPCSQDSPIREKTGRLYQQERPVVFIDPDQRGAGFVHTSTRGTAEGTRWGQAPSLRVPEDNAGRPPPHRDRPARPSAPERHGWSPARAIQRTTPSSTLSPHSAVPPRSVSCQNRITQPFRLGKPPRGPASRTPARTAAGSAARWRRPAAAPGAPRCRRRGREAVVRGVFGRRGSFAVLHRAVPRSTLRLPAAPPVSLTKR